MVKKPDILHVIAWEKFTPSYIAFVERNFRHFESHCFFVLGWNSAYYVPRKANVIFGHELRKHRRVARLVRLMNTSRKILLHGLFDTCVLGLLAVQPWLLGRSYWAIWGGDLYDPPSGSWPRRNAHELLRRIVFKRLGHLLTYVGGDVDLARQRYGARGAHHECLLYPSNCYRHTSLQPKSDGFVNVQVGNSADPSNGHLEVFDLLADVATEATRIYVPLSYGDPGYAAEVIERGAKIFGDRFIALTDFLPWDKYLEFLGRIDIAIFNHKRQQAMGNTITLLGLGKTVFMRTDVAQWNLFRKIGVRVCAIDDLDLRPLPEEDAAANQRAIRNYFSEINLIRQYSSIFQ